MLNQFSRTQLLLGQDDMERLFRARVAVFGIGGVGGYTVEALARSGVGTLDLYTPPQLHGGPLAQAVRRAGGTLFREVTYPTDHFFADYRLAVAGTVTEVLKGQLPQ